MGALAFFSFRRFLAVFSCFAFFFLNSCGGGSPSFESEGVFGPAVAGDPHDFRGAGVIGDPKYLIGGPLAQGRIGDVLLQNDKIRVVIQKPRRNAGVALYGGNILDADLLRPAGEEGQDHFGVTFPLLNVSWTPFYKRVEILNGDFSKGPLVVRATGILNVYDYIQAAVIVPFARLAKGIQLFFPDQFNDVLDPFSNLPSLRQISTTIVTDYILRQDRNYVILQTHVLNQGTDPVKFPIGDWVNGSGTLEIFLPGVGYTKQGLYSGNLPGGIPGIVYPGMETNVNVSYGYFYDPALLLKEDGSFLPTDLLTISRVSIMMLGEHIAPGVIPLGSSTPPAINFSLPTGETTYVRYFVVGNGDVGSVLSGGMQAVGIPSYPLAGKVVDSAGRPVAKAKVLVMDSEAKKPVNMFYSDANGDFSGWVSTGIDTKAKLFGSGHYTIEVYKEGYVDPSSLWPSGDQAYQASLAGRPKAGRCDATQGNDRIRCTLGQSGLVSVTIRDETGNFCPARLSIVGFDPSPYHALEKSDDPNSPTDDSSLVADLDFQFQRYGYVDTLLFGDRGEIAIPGNARVAGQNSFHLEPGDYEIVITRGPEYSRFLQRIRVKDGETTEVSATLRKVVDTSGYLSGDFHIHGIRSPDSPFSQRSRVYAAMAEGLDLMVSADHDAVTDYRETITELGLQDWIWGLPGNEITSNSYGHFIVFPLDYHPDDPMGGSFDYTKREGTPPGPSHHELLSPGEILTGVDQTNSGEQVLQIAHILDKILGNFSLARLVTTPHFDGIPVLASYTDPVDLRLAPNSNVGGGFRPPYAFGSNVLVTDQFTSLELCIGHSQFQILMESSLPTYFNFLNLGKQASATCSSDSHSQMTDYVGDVRNFIRSSVDPRDRQGNFNQIRAEEIAHDVNAHHMVVTTGPFVRFQVKSAGGQVAQIGDTLNLGGEGSKEVDLLLHVESPDWIDWDSVEVYVNTDPIPAEDDLSGPWKGTAEEFVTITPTHTNGKYLYAPVILFQRGGDAGAFPLNQQVVDGKRFVDLEKKIPFSEDSWILVLVRGSDKAQSLFPYAPSGVKTRAPELAPEKFLDTFEAQQQTLLSPNPGPDLIGGFKAFAFTNPIFVDVDGNGWQAKWVREGLSPLARP